VRRSVYCTSYFSVCSRRRTKFPLIYPDLRLDYKVATHPSGVSGSSHPFLPTESLFRFGDNRSQVMETVDVF
jgi:hypothetical protein